MQALIRQRDMLKQRVAQRYAEQKQDKIEIVESTDDAIKAQVNTISNSTQKAPSKRKKVTLDDLLKNLYRTSEAANDDIYVSPNNYVKTLKAPSKNTKNSNAKKKLDTSILQSAYSKEILQEDNDMQYIPLNQYNNLKKIRAAKKARYNSSKEKFKRVSPSIISKTPSKDNDAIMNSYIY